MAGRRAARRLLLLVAVATGVVGMHTLGHPGTRHGGAGCAPILMAGHPPVGVHAMRVGAPADPVRVGAVVACVERGLNPMDVCLAILTTVGLVGLIRALRQSRWVALRPRASEAGTLSATGRGPPAVTPFGLAIADLSVLRT